MLRNFKRSKHEANSLKKSPPSKIYSLSVDIATRILGYVKFDNHYSRNMHNFALVETSWLEPATFLLYTHVSFESYNCMLKYILKIRQNSNYASAARTLCLSSITGPLNPEIHFYRLVELCPNIVSFKVFKCPSTWITDSVLLAMANHWPRLAELSLRHRDRCYGQAFITAVRNWPGLTHLDLNNVSGIDSRQYCRIIELLPNLHSLRLSREVNNRDHMSDSLLYAINNTSRSLKAIEFNNCARLTKFPILNCLKSLADTLECLVITGSKQIPSITLAEIIVACYSLRFINVSRTYFDDEALRYLCGTRASKSSPEVAPRICKRIEQFAMSDCSRISLQKFCLFANVLGSHVRDGHVKGCIVYIQRMSLILPRNRMKEIEKSNPGLRIKAGHEGFMFDKIIESSSGRAGCRADGLTPVAGSVAKPVG